MVRRKSRWLINCNTSDERGQAMSKHRNTDTYADWQVWAEKKRKRENKLQTDCGRTNWTEQEFWKEAEVLTDSGAQHRHWHFSEFSASGVGTELNCSSLTDSSTELQMCFSAHGKCLHSVEIGWVVSRKRKRKILLFCWLLTERIEAKEEKRELGRISVELRKIAGRKSIKHSIKWKSQFRFRKGKSTFLSFTYQTISGGSL